MTSFWKFDILMIIVFSCYILQDCNISIEKGGRLK